jgi:ketosteroid isomerase-like protein
VLNPTHPVHRLVENINSHDVDAIVALLTSDHRFVDSLGNMTLGREALRAGWRHYFRMVPDYQIAVERALADGQHVVLVGVAGGTYAPDGVLLAQNAWSTPIAVRALIHEGLIAEWQVYADNEPMRRRMAGETA